MDGLLTIRSPSGAPFSVHKDYAPRFQGLIDDLHASGYGINPDQSGGYNPRMIAGTNTPSQHAYGRAIDVNWNANARGSQGDIPPDLVRSLAAKHGLTWGGDWKNPDPMHFEVAGGSPVPVAQRGLTSYAGMSPPEASPTPVQPASQPQTNGTQKMGLLDSPDGGSWFDTIGPKIKGWGENLNDASRSPLFQFGAGMAGAGSQGLGLGGGFAGGAKALQEGQMNNVKQGLAQRELDQAMQRDKFIAGLNDPNNPLARGMSPETMAALRGLPSDQAGLLLTQLLGRRGDLEMQGRQAQQQAGIDVNKALAIKRGEQGIAQQGLDYIEKKYGRPPQGGPPAPPPGTIMDGHRFKGGNPADQSSWEKL